MPERRQATSQSSQRSTINGVRRNLFHQHLSRRPTTSSTSTSAETLRLDIEPESDTSDIVIRDKNGDFETGDPPIQNLDDQEEGNLAHEDDSNVTTMFRNRMRANCVVEERMRLADAVKHHQRDRNRAPSEPAGALSAVRATMIYAEGVQNYWKL